MHVLLSSYTFTFQDKEENESVDCGQNKDREKLTVTEVTGNWKESNVGLFDL